MGKLQNEGACLPNPNCELISQKRGLKSEGSASHLIFKYPMSACEIYRLSDAWSDDLHADA